MHVQWSLLAISEFAGILPLDERLRTRGDFFFGSKVELRSSNPKQPTPSAAVCRQCRAPDWTNSLAVERPIDTPSERWLIIPSERRSVNLRVEARSDECPVIRGTWQPSRRRRTASKLPDTIRVGEEMRDYRRLKYNKSSPRGKWYRVLITLISSVVNSAAVGAALPPSIT